MSRLWPYWRLKAAPHTEYKLVGLANMHPNWEAYTIMECATGGMWELFKNEDLGDILETSDGPEED